MVIIDMEAWMEGCNVFYQHYQKPVSSKPILNAQSTQSAACKRSVHTMEIVRRILNTSTKLDWNTCIAPVLTEYMCRMKHAGYGEGYRKGILTRGLNIYDKMREEDGNGSKPLNRPNEWQEDERRNKKNSKRNAWSSRGGYVTPLFIPATPGVELAKIVREVAEKEGELGLEFNILE